MCILRYLSYLTDFFKVETWSCSWTIYLSKIFDILIWSLYDCIQVGLISDISKSLFSEEFIFLKIIFHWINFIYHKISEVIKVLF